MLIYFNDIEILVSIEESRHILTRYKSLTVSYTLEDIVNMLRVELRKEIVEQENRLFFTHRLDEINFEKFEPEEDGFIFSSRKVFICPKRFLIMYMDLECKIIEMGSYIGVPGDDIPLPFLSEVCPNTPGYIREIHLGYVFETQPVFSLK